MVRKTKEEAQETRNLILDTAEAVFSEKGVSRTTLNDIANLYADTRVAQYDRALRDLVIGLGGVNALRADGETANGVMNAIDFIAKPTRTIASDLSAIEQELASRRLEADVVLTDASLSRRHARMWCRP